MAEMRTPPTAQSAPPPLPLLVSEDDAAAMCGVSKQTFRRWVAEGLITPVAPPHGMRRRLYLHRDLEAFVECLAAKS